MSTLYLDIFSGISGDMFLGALIDAGVDAKSLERELGKLALKGYELCVSRGTKSGIAGVKVDVCVQESRGPVVLVGGHHEHRTFAQIREMIAGSELSTWVKEKAVAMFWRIAAAEGKIHGMSAEKVHFHEVGAVDSIVDVVGACIALEMLGKPRVLAGAVVEGTGWIDCAHGRLPVPAPATAAILGERGVAITQCEEPHELVTPTGAAILAEFVETFGPMRGLVPAKIGFGLGTRDNKYRANVLRVLLDTQAGPTTGSGWETDEVAVLETNLDDINAEILGNFVETALVAGALDVFHTPIQMKKNRPGVLLTVLCNVADAGRFSAMMLRETSAFGVRETIARRRKLRRTFGEVETCFGRVTVKFGELNGEILHTAPEFESCRAVALAAGVTLKQVYEAAMAAGRTRT